MEGEEMSIEDLRNDVQVLTAELNKATEKYHVALIAAQPLRVGDRTVSPSHGEAEITMIKIGYDDRVDLYGRKITKSGALHPREQKLYEWNNWKVER